MQKQAQYITNEEINDGLEMFWQDKPKELPSVLSGFTPAPDALIKKYGYVTALIWGRVWRYCQYHDGVCRAKLETIARELNMSVRNVIRDIKELCKDGYLLDTTPNLRNRPHIYADTGKIRIRITVDVTENGMTQSHSTATVSHRQSDSESHEESIKKESKKKDTVLSEKEIEQANAKVDAMLMGNKDQQPLIDFERSFGFGTLPWYSNSTWDKFRKFILRTAEQNPGWMADYAAWRLDGGKYKAFSNRKIRENPAAFMDTGYPEYEASKMYRVPSSDYSGPRPHKLG